MLDDLETEDLHTHTTALIVLVAAGGPRGLPALVVLTRVPPGHHEVAVLADHRTQQLEALEALRGVNPPLTRGEPLLNLGLRSLGEGQCGDVDIGHGVLLGDSVGSGPEQMSHRTLQPEPMTTAPFTRKDGRAVDELRPVTMTRHWLDHAEGSVLVTFGRTRVLCAASFTEGVPRWRKGSGEGWVTAEYAMLPRAGSERSGRESVRGKVGGRTHEISRLIGRSLRGIIDVAALGENTIALDCDVLQADGGTRTAAITGAYVALADAVAWGTERGLIKARSGKPVLSDSLSAISVGIIDGVPCLDLPYEEDVRAQTDMNVVQTGDGRFIEVQGTAEHAPFDRSELGALLDLAAAGNSRLAALQHRALAGPNGEPFTVSSSQSSSECAEV